MKVINTDLMTKKGLIIPNIDKCDSELDKINLFIEFIRKKFNVNILIQSDITYRIDVTEYTCIIGRNLDDYGGALILSNGTGNSFSEAIIASINEFTEYYRVNYDLLTE